MRPAVLGTAARMVRGEAVRPVDLRSWVPQVAAAGGSPRPVGPLSVPCAVAAATSIDDGGEAWTTVGGQDDETRLPTDLAGATGTGSGDGRRSGPACPPPSRRLPAPAGADRSASRRPGSPGGRRAGPRRASRSSRRCWPWPTSRLVAVDARGRDRRPDERGGRPGPGGAALPGARRPPDGRLVDTSATAGSPRGSSTRSAARRRLGDPRIFYGLGWLRDPERHFYGVPLDDRPSTLGRGWWRDDSAAAGTPSGAAPPETGARPAPPPD